MVNDIHKTLLIISLSNLSFIISHVHLQNFMKKTKLLPLCILIILFQAGCSRKVTMEKIPTPQISFGSGGGFTNLITEYILLEDGKIVKKSKEGERYDIIARIGKDKAAQCYIGAKVLKLDTLQFNEPGNMYYFVTLKKDDKTENRIVWGSVDKPISDEVKSFHKLLLSFLSKKNEKEAINK